MLAWFQLIIEHVPTLISIFRVAYAKHKTVEVSLVLTSIRLGFYSENETVCSLALQAMQMIAEQLYQVQYEYGITVKKLKNKNQIIEVKVPIFRQFQDWFIQPKKLTIVNKNQKQQQTSTVVGDPTSVLRIISFESIENHPNLSAQIARLFLSVFKEVQDPGLPPTANISHLPEKLAEVFSDDIFLSYNALSTVLPEMRSLDRSQSQFLISESNLVYSLLIRASEVEEDPSVRLLCTTLLLDLWYDEHSLLIQMQPTRGDNIPVKDAFYDVLRAGLLHPDKVYRLTLFGSAFGVLDHLIQMKSVESPVFLKVLLNCLLYIMGQKGKKDRITEEFCLQNFIELYEKYPDIPLPVLIEPISVLLTERIKGERKQGGSQHKPGTLSSQEIYFLLRISKHEKLSQGSAFLILELLSTIYMTRSSVALALLPQIVSLVKRFQQSNKIMSFVDTIMIPKALSMILTLKKDEQLKTSQSPYVQNVLAITQGGSTSSSKALPRKLTGQEQVKKSQATIKTQRYQMVHLCEKLLQEEIPAIEPIITEQIKPLQDRYSAIFKATSPAYDYLISRYHLKVPQHMLQLQYRSVEGSNTDTLVLQGSQSDGKILRTDNSIDALQEKVNTIQRKRAMSNKKHRALLWTEMKEPKNEIALKAIEQMNEIRIQRLRKQNQERIEEVRKKEHFDKIQEQASQEVAMSKLILDREQAQRKQRVREILADQNPTGTNDSPSKLDRVAGSGADDLNPFYSLILDSPVQPMPKQSLSDLELKILQNFSRGNTGMHLVNFELDEEDRERDAMRLLVHKNRPLFAYLFKKYSSLGSLNRKRGSIESVTERTISFGDIQRFFKETGFDSAYMSQKELQQMVKMINDFFFLRHGNQALEFQGFVQLIIQGSIYMHRKGRFKDVSSKQALGMMYSQMVYNTLNQVKDQAQHRGETQFEIYLPQDDPRAAYQKAASKQTFPKGAKPPPLPKVSAEKAPVQWFEYKLAPQARMPFGESKTIVLDLLDDLFKVNFDFSIYESVARVGEITEKSAREQLPPSTRSFDEDSEHKFRYFDDFYPYESGQSKKRQKLGKKASKTKVRTASVSESSKPKGLDIYSVQNIIKTAGLKKLNEKRNTRKDKENEQILMGLNVSAPLKLACFELQQVNPQSQLDDMRDISLTLEGMLSSIAEEETYRSTIEKPIQKRKFRLPQSLPKLQTVKQKELVQEQTQADKEDRIVKNEKFFKRGQILKDQLLDYKRMKQERDQQKQDLDLEAKQYETLKYQKQQERLQKQKEQLLQQNSEKEESQKWELRKSKLRSEVTEMHRYSKQKIFQLCTHMYNTYRKRFIATQFSIEQTKFYNDQETHKVVEQYQDNANIQKQFGVERSQLQQTFQDLLVFQNQTSRSQGMPQHRGVNLDGILNFCIKTELVPQFFTIQDVCFIVKKAVETRKVLPVEVNAQTEPLKTQEPPLMQKVNFNDLGGHMNYAEFELLIARLVGYLEVIKYYERPDGTTIPLTNSNADVAGYAEGQTKQSELIRIPKMKEDLPPDELDGIEPPKSENKDYATDQDFTPAQQVKPEQNDPISSLRKESKALGLENELESKMQEVVQSWDNLKLYAQILQDQNSSVADRGELYFHAEQVEGQLEQYFDMAMPTLKKAKDMHMPLLPVGSMGSLDLKTTSVVRDYRTVQPSAKESGVSRQRNKTATPNKQIELKQYQRKRIRPQIRGASESGPSGVPLRQSTSSVPASSREQLGTDRNYQSKTLITSQRSSKQLTDKSKPNADFSQLLVEQAYMKDTYQD